MVTDFHLVWSDTQTKPLDKSFLFVSFLMIDSHQKKLYHVNLCKMQAKLLLKVMILRAIEHGTLHTLQTIATVVHRS